jgi:hypothetical protein
MHQLELFSTDRLRAKRSAAPDTAVRARATDPASSHHAADKMQKTGKGRAQQLQVWELIRLHRGLTSMELSRTDTAKSMGLDRHMIARRLPELRQREEARNGAQRTCGVTGELSLTWWPRRKDGVTR